MSEETIFAEALRTPAHRRAEFLSQACAGDAELRRRVEQLLTAHDNPDSIFESPEKTEAGAAAPATSLPKRLGDFEIIRQIGRGGMGIVYEARQVSLNRRVALKVLSSGLGLTAKAVMRFRREAEAAAKLHHTNIVPIYATGEDGGVHFYAMELIAGPSLDEVIRHMLGDPGNQDLIDDETTAEALPDWVDATMAYQPSRPTSSSSSFGSTTSSSSLSAGSGYFDAVANMIADVADALEHAHDQGVIHRDIKPSNLLLSPDGRLSVNDFGLARMLEQPGMTMTGEFVGSPLYMSPEQITAGRAPLDHRTDIYSLGATLYELLTLQPPFPGSSRDQVIGQILHKEPKAPRRLNKKIPADLETICLKAIERDPDRRYLTCEKLAHDLRSYVNRHAITARRITAAERVIRWARRHRSIAAMAVCSIALGLALLMLAWRNHLSEQQLRRSRAMDEALAAAMNGDIAAAESAIIRAELEGASVAWVRMLNGEVAMFQGDNKTAIVHLERAVALEPTSIAARSALAVAYLGDSQWDRYLEAMAELDSAKPETVEDKIFLARPLTWLDPEHAIRLLDEALEVRHSPIAYFHRCAALSFHGMDKLDLELIELALDDGRTATKLLKNNPVAQISQHYSRLAAVSVYRRLGNDSKATKILDDATENVRFFQRTSLSLDECFQAGYHYRFRNEFQRAVDLYREPLRHGDIGFGSHVVAASGFQLGKPGEALSMLDAIPTPRSHHVEYSRTILLVEVHQDPAIALDEWKQTMDRPNWSNRQGSYFDVLWLLGNRNEIVERADNALKSFQTANTWTFPRDLLRFQAGRIKAEELIEIAQRSGRDLGIAHYNVALEQLSRGDRRGARESFRKSIARGVFHWGEVTWSEAFLERMDADPEWPSWLPHE